ncbi:MAG: type II toxin-antitoxin system Phd/YefM family antitoxin [Dehalococcoidia bacterium]|nr:type II toxin-antitoxin system Phd/YefM family antitoxin [Dehalococcoidia bacterium]
MPKVRVVPISEARPNLTSLVEEVGQSHEPCFIASHSKVKAVLLAIDEYDSLIDRLEDLEDSLDILRSRLSKESSRSLEEFLGELDEHRREDVRRRA